MPTFSSFITETHNNVSPGFVDVLIQTRREELFTGLMQLRYPTGANLVFAFVAGVEQQLYRYHENTTEIIPRPAWHQLVNSPNASVGLLELPLEALRVIRVAHEAPVSREEQLSLSSAEFLACTNKWLLEAEPSIIHVQGAQLDQMYLLANCTNSAVESIAYVDSSVRYSGSEVFLAPNVGGLQVRRYVSAQAHAVWREYELRLAFNPLARLLMKRFGELAGRGLAERLGGQISAWARGGGWNIFFSGDSVINHQYFDSLEAAVDAYTDILRCFQDEAGIAIGLRMTENILMDVLSRLDTNCRELLLQFIFTQSEGGSLVVRNE